MAAGKNTFTAYCEWGEIFNSLPDKEAGKLVKHMFDYVNDKDPKTDDVLINATFAGIRSTLKRDLKRWLDKCEKNKEIAIEREKNKRISTNVHERSKKSTNSTDKDKDKDKDKEVRKGPPTIFEVMNFFEENGYTEFSAKKAFECYDENDWHDTKGNSVKNWKLKMRNVWFTPQNKIKKQHNKAGIVF